MRLVTWNCCRGDCTKKVSLLDSWRPDIAVIQECAKPFVQSDRCLWFGDNPNSGLAVRSSNAYQLRALPVVPEAPKYVIPIEVTGPTEFVLFAVWTLGEKPHPYVRAASRAVELYRDLIERRPTVLIGDFNSNAIWDSEHPAEMNHSALVRQLERLDLVSAYHHARKETHGGEREPTFYFQWNRAKPFHIGYCFVPRAWAPRIKRVDVGSFDGWSSHSDHRPLLVDIVDSIA